MEVFDFSRFENWRLFIRASEREKNRVWEKKMAPGLLTEQNSVTTEQLSAKVEKISIDKKDQNLYDDKENGFRG